MLRFFRLFVVSVALLCATSMAVAQDRPRVIAVNYPLQYFAERLLGEEAEVIFPVPADVDPSFWRPSISDISMIQSADLILLNGAGFATWVDRVSLPRAKTVTTTAAIEDQFIVTESITHSHGDGGEHSHEGLASYTWLDPSLAAAQAEAIAAAIMGRGLADTVEIDARLADLLADLATLDTATSLALGDFAGVTVIATHPRYQYLARRYDLAIVSLDWEAGADPDQGQLAALAALANDAGAEVLIWEAAPSDAALEATLSLGLQNVVFDPMARGPGGASIISAMEAAVSELAQSLERRVAN